MTWQPWVTVVTVKGATGVALREADRGPEPDLARLRPDGPLSGLQPLDIVG